ncbi:MAG: thioredoxin family protein [Bacteroidales bacterium]|nr:thioredoxin family protein [Bacteroidales bacterium]
MQKLLFLTLGFLLAINTVQAGDGYSVGDKASDFKLKNVDGKTVSLSDYTDAKGFIVIFTCNDCPYAKAYQDRIIALDKKYKAKGYPVIAINPNNPEVSPGDSYKNMQQRAKEKSYTFPYLFDEKFEVYKTYGATRTPHVFLLKKENKDLVVSYIGTIDDNYQDPGKVQQQYLANAVESLIAGKSPDPEMTKAIGCTIKQK